MIKVPKDIIIEKIKDKSGLSDKEIQSRIKDKLDQLSGLISEEGALHIIANELGVKLFEESGKLDIKNVMAGMRNVELTGKVVRVYEVRNFETEKRKGKVGNFLLGDNTGVIRIVAWNDKADILNKLAQDMVIRIENGYARENRGRMEVHLGNKTKVILNPEDAPDIDVKEITIERKKIKDLNENESNVEILGTIVQVFDPRFWEADPDTGKKAIMKDGDYYVDDKKLDEITYSYVTNLFLDDGSDNIRVVLWRNQTQKLFDMDHEEIVEKKDGDFEEIKNDLLGKIVKFQGRTNKNEMFDRIEFVPNLVVRDPEPEEESKRLKEELKKEQEKSPEPKETPLSEKQGEIERTEEVEEELQSEESIDTTEQENEEEIKERYEEPEEIKMVDDDEVEEDFTKDEDLSELDEDEELEEVEDIDEITDLDSL